MRAAFAGGGSAGHLSPALAIAQRFLREAPEAEALFFGANRPLDRALLAPYRHHLLSATGLPYGLSLRTVSGLLRMARAAMQALGACREFRPDVIVGTGGYISAAAVPAATMQGTPAVIHVSDALPDRSNLRLASRAARITVAFEAAAEHFPADKVLVTGQPVREEFLQVDREAARAARGYAPEDLVLMVTGGSQGARVLNEATIGAAAELLADGLCVFHLTGRLDYERMASEARQRGLGPRYQCREYEMQMAEALAAADLVVMRAGSSSLAEASTAGLPMVVVPLPHAHGHQKVNAAALEQQGAALVVDNEQMNPGRLLETVRGLVAAPDTRGALSAAALAWGARGAADRIAAEVIAVAGG